MSIDYDPALVEQVSYNLDLREPELQQAPDALAKSLVWPSRARSSSLISRPVSGRHTSPVDCSTTCMSPGCATF